MKLKQDNFLRIDSDYNGNPRYYLPQYLAEEEDARPLGGKKYRGKKYGAGWVFCTYNLNSVINLLNSANPSLSKPDLYNYINTRMIEAAYVPMTDQRGERIKIFERARYSGDRMKSKVFSYDYDYADVATQALSKLEQAGFNIVCRSSTPDSYVFLCHNWADEYIEINDIK